jgi:hypothetical protein
VNGSRNYVKMLKKAKLNAEKEAKEAKEAEKEDDE